MQRSSRRFRVMALIVVTALVGTACDAGWMALHAGTGTAGTTGDGGPRTDITMQRPGAVVFAPDGGYYVVDDEACVIRHVADGGTVATVAGTGECGYGGDGGPATSARIAPVVPGREATTGGLSLAADGTLYLADAGNQVVRAVAPDGTITTAATAGGCTGTLGEGGIAATEGFVVVGCGSQGMFVAHQGTAIAVPFFAGVQPGAMTVAPDGTLYYFDRVTRTIWRTVDAAGTTEPVAAIDNPVVTALSVDADGYVYFVEGLDSGAARVQRIVPSNMRTTVIAGTLEPDAGAAQRGQSRHLHLTARGIAVTAHRGLLVSSGHGVYRINDPRNAPAALARPFYEHGADVLDGSSPGTIIRYEKVPTSQYAGRWKANLRGTVYRVMYHSRDIHDADTAVTGVIVVPKAPAPAGGYRVLSSAHGNVGMNNWCAPSRFPGWGEELSTTQLDDYLDDGFIWAATDYEGFGPDGSLRVWSGQTEARNAIDIARAAHHLAAEPELDVGPVDEDFVVIGNSAGGRASLFTNREAATYHQADWQQVNLVGTVAAGIPSQLELLFAETVQDHGLNNYVYNLVFGINATYGDEAAPVDELLNQTGRSLLALAAQSPFDRTAEPSAGYCHPDHGQRFNSVARRIDQYLQPQSDGGHNPIVNEKWAPLILEQDAATWEEPGSVPLLIVQGDDDVVTRAFSSEMLAGQLCGLGQDLERWNYLDKAHTTTMPAAHGHMKAWIQNRFAGEPTPEVTSPVAGASNVDATVCVGGVIVDR